MTEQPSSSDQNQLTTPPPAVRGIFCNRTLNMRAIRAIGYDMDYTLIHYRVDAWERHAYEYLRRKLLARGWPVDELSFDAEIVARGLIIDIELGNVVKANRFGYIKEACHGTRHLSYEQLRDVYALTFVELSVDRFVFINTLFSLSEVCMYAQLVDKLDARELPEVLGYADLYREVRQSLDEAHWEGDMKAEIMSDPDRFIHLDEEIPLTLQDQREAGKKLMLITNSEWRYTREVMSYAFDRFLPGKQTWRDLFDLVIVAARKPEFFSTNSPMFEVVDERGRLEPVAGRLREPGIYLGGNAGLVERHLGLSGAEFLYVGDHIFVDVNVSKNLLHWRTALIVRELERDIRAIEQFESNEQALRQLMAEKERLELQSCALRLQLQRLRRSYGPPVTEDQSSLQKQLTAVKQQLAALDQRISPLARAASEMGSPRWGLLMRAGNDKSHLARQVERYADVYTSRVSNFLYRSPFVYLRSPRGSLPHDPEPVTLPDATSP